MSLVTVTMLEHPLVVCRLKHFINSQLDFN